MLERLRMQEVSQIILSVPEGAIINGTNLKYGEPVMIIEKPSTSTLTFTNSAKKNESRGFISTSEQTKSIDFTINEGTILYSLWSYLNGINTVNTTSTLKGTEYLTLPSTGNKLTLSSHGDITNLIVYKNNEGQLTKLTPNQDYTAYYETIGGVKNNFIELTKTIDKNYFVCYNYTISNVDISSIKQVHNNIFCTLDMYFDAVDTDTDDKHTVCLHCDKVQVLSNLGIGINNSQKASFTPIEIHSIAEGGNVNKNIATITVI